VVDGCQSGSRTAGSRQGLTDVYRPMPLGVSDSHPSTPSASQGSLGPTCRDKVSGRAVADWPT